MNRSLRPISTRLSGLLKALCVAAFIALAMPAPEAFADSLREVAEQLAREHNGQVVSARVVERGGRRFYVIRILTDDGVVRTFRVPAEDRT